ncbi:MAG: hypothetical protein ABEJ98_04080 [Candidatus Nanohaloarchaea archaeon]
MKQQIVELAEELCEHAPRMWEAENDAAKVIKRELDERGVDYEVQPYGVVYPRFTEYRLEVDGEEVECLPAGLESGKIESKTVIDNLHISGRDFSGPNINFNPVSEGLSKPTFYPAPALTVSRKDVPKVLEADEIEGTLEVEREQHRSENIILGETEDPERLIFTHYDSWWGAFLDNALSVSLLVHLAPELDLENDCIVFAGSEEFSDEEIYWCYGYRKFEEEYFDAVRNAETITVVDTVGRGDTQVADSEELIREGLVLNYDGYVEKTEMLIGEFDKIMEIYHSPLDTREAATHIDDAIETVRSYLL